MLVQGRRRPTRTSERAKRAKALFKGRRKRPIGRTVDRPAVSRPRKPTTVDLVLWFG